MSFLIFSKYATQTLNYFRLIEDKLDEDNYLSMYNEMHCEHFEAFE